MVNKVILIGNLGQDPDEPRKTSNGTSVVDISIATVRRNKNGENSTDWHTVTCWGRTAEIVHQYLKKGRQVYIEGRLQYDLLSVGDPSGGWSDVVLGLLFYRSTRGFDESLVELARPLGYLGYVG